LVVFVVQSLTFTLIVADEFALRLNFYHLSKIARRFEV